MTYHESIRIEATAERIWEILTDVERWPTWTASMSEVRRLDREPFGVGSRVRVKQPRLPTTQWVVTECEPGRSFTWTSRGGGVTSLADHRIRVDEGVTVELILRQSGLLTPLIGLVAGNLTRRYLRMEAEGLKERAERDT
ncbi:polyketide cyclase [Embleya scabrispora]|uniref:Polyketide cyclase n=1 Tax=Embleya scabrispora TaxID=159449 RepID=A0A1T3P6R7_9ACTN|nr:SRPBCC family protein [Embleya scabrispora]OPC84743.1 polyketide cyclase [Embleya scabrispora]